MDKKRLYFVFGVGIIVRLFLSFSTFHPDIRAFALGGDLIARGHILDFYDYLRHISPSSNLVKVFGTDLFIYPPFIYWVHGFFALFWRLIFPQFDAYSTSPGSFIGNSSFNIYLLLLKIPNLIVDLLTAVFIIKLFDTPRKKMIAAILWLFNPVTLYASFMMGQFDIFATFFVVLSLFYLKKKRPGLSALALGFGIAFKIYPLFLVPVLVLYTKSNFQRLKIVGLSLVPYLLSIFIYLPSHGFRSSALVAGQTLKSFYASIPISGGESLLLFPLFLIVFYLFVWYFPPQQNQIGKFFIYPLVVFFVFTHYHPQWFLWITPFLLLLLIESDKVKFPILGMVLSFTGLLFFFDPSLTVTIFAPLIPPLKEAPSLWMLLHLNPDYNFSRSLLQTVFAACAGYLAIINFKQYE